MGAAARRRARGGVPAVGHADLRRGQAEAVLAEAVLAEAVLAEAVQARRCRRCRRAVASCWSRRPGGGKSLSYPLAGVHPDFRKGRTTDLEDGRLAVLSGAVGHRTLARAVVEDADLLAIGA